MHWLWLERLGGKKDLFGEEMNLGEGRRGGGLR